MKKSDQYSLLGKEIVPKRSIADNTIDIKKHANAIGLPCILKPDTGCRGVDVHKIYSISDLDFISLQKRNYIIQEFVEGIEFGIFIFYDNKLEITGIAKITLKTVIGDGVSSVKELISQKEYAGIKIDYKSINLNEVLPKGVVKKITFLGNHAQGSTCTHIKGPYPQILIEKMTQIVTSIGVDYGRFDVISQSLEDLYAGSFKILEFNGVTSEPLHMYDYDLSKGYTIRRDHRERLGKLGKKSGSLSLKKKRSLLIGSLQYIALSLFE